MNLKGVADYLTTALNDNELQYDVTDNVQLFDEEMKLGDKKYVPCILTLVSPFVEENTYRQSFVFNMHFRFEREYIDDFYDDIETFIAGETPATEGTFQVVKTYQMVRFAKEDTDNGLDYYEFDLEFTWVYNLSIVGRSTTITIDGVAIPFTSCNVEHDTSYVSNQSSTTNYRMTNDIIRLSIPLILTNTKVSAIYTDINSDAYNKGYTLVINGISKSVILKKATYQIDNNSNIVGMVLTLETAYPRVTLTLDGETIANTAYRYNAKTLSLPAKRSGTGKTLAYPTEKVNSWSITMVKDSSTVYAKVIADAYGSTIDTTYTLVRDGVSYTVFLADAVEQYTETGDMAIECQFLEYGNDI